MDPDQLKTFISNFNQSGQDNFKTSGCNLGGTKYMYLSSNEKVARFKKGTSGVHTIKTTQGKLPTNQTEESLDLQCNPKT